MLACVCLGMKCNHICTACIFCLGITVNNSSYILWFDRLLMIGESIMYVC